jgi:hypothetical protein
MQVVSYTRSGTHYLMALVHRNLATPYEDYEGLHFSHSRIPDAPYIHLHRPVLPTMVSIWRAREHLGIAAYVSFADMIRTPWPSMPRSKFCVAVFNGRRDDRVCPPRDFDGRLPDRWLLLNRLFAEGATLSFTLDDAVSHPLIVLERISIVTGWPFKREFSPVTGRVGWWAVNEEQPDVSWDDLRYLRRFQECLRSQ